jgi:predicted kinase
MSIESLIASIKEEKIKATKPIIIMMVGLPGSGKSTLIKKILSEIDNIHVESTDDLIEEEANQLGLTYSEAFKIVNFKEIEKKAVALSSLALQEGKSIIIDQTNMSLKSRKKKIDRFRGFSILAIDIKVSSEVLTKRLKDRSALTGKHIPQFVIETMTNNYAEPSIAEGFSVVYYYQ